MSVRKNLRKKTKMQVIDDANNLCVEMIDHVFRENVLPKKYRMTFSSQLLNESRHIRELICAANDIYPPNNERITIQSKAIIMLESLLRRIDDLIDAGVINYENISTLMYSIDACHRSLIAWNKSDIKRVSQTNK